MGDLDAVIAQLKLEQVVLVAHDASGPPAIDWALAHAERVAALDQFEHQFPQIQVQRTGKFVDEGPIMTAAALTAGFHMALHVVERLLGEQMAQAVAKGIDMEGHKPRE